MQKNEVNDNSKLMSDKSLMKFIGGGAIVVASSLILSYFMYKAFNSSSKTYIDNKEMPETEIKLALEEDDDLSNEQVVHVTKNVRGKTVNNTYNVYERGGAYVVNVDRQGAVSDNDDDLDSDDDDFSDDGDLDEDLIDTEDSTLDELDNDDSDDSDDSDDESDLDDNDTSSKSSAEEEISAKPVEKPVKDVTERVPSSESETKDEESSGDGDSEEEGSDTDMDDDEDDDEDDDGGEDENEDEDELEDYSLLEGEVCK